MNPGENPRLRSLRQYLDEESEKLKRLPLDSRKRSGVVRRIVQLEDALAAEGGIEA